ncbi:hypothetical protein OPT61_g712 [Boeremia exigua]|uniref:Uncharacterized protein n=1 Tax=Boeremia exigua TaxID=749465 RepID=A0ACC2IT88_9PLEO|nr:hypothetical protein OPT61_g712 [Boeremia exigua]
MMTSRTVIAHGLIALSFLSTSTLAQDSDRCSALAPELAYNASATVEIPALNLVYLGAGTERPRIENETDFTWQLSSYIQPRLGDGSSSENSTQTVVWLDIKSSDTERLGSEMGMCHNFVPLRLNSNLAWSRAALEASVQDTGDCRKMVSEACLDRLKVQYESHAMGERDESSSCNTMDTNNTVPWECAESGMMAEPINRENPDFNASLETRFPVWSNESRAVLAQSNDSLVCDGRNFSSSFGTYATDGDYDVDTNFPLMDIMTFSPRVSSGRIQDGSMHRVQISCLVPGAVTEGSREKESVESVLETFNATNDDQAGNNQTGDGDTGDDKSAGATTFGRGVETWTLLVWALSVGCAFAV